MPSSFFNLKQTQVKQQYKAQPLAATEAEKAEQHERLQNADIHKNGGIGGNQVFQAIGDTPPETRYTVRALDIVRFNQLPEKEQTSLIIRKKFPELPHGRGFDYHRRAKGGMRGSLRSGRHDNADAKIVLLQEEAKKANGRTKSELETNIRDLEQFKRLYTESELQGLGKRKHIPVGNEKKFLNLDQFKITLAPDYVYTTEVKGQKEVGALLLLVTNDVAYTDGQMRLLAHMLRELVMQQFPDLGDAKPHERFIVADVYRKKRITAPKPVDLPTKELDRNLRAFAELWGNISL